MSLWSNLFRRRTDQPPSPVDVPLPILIHSHRKDALPPGPLENGMVEVQHEEIVVHAVAGVFLSDGTIGDLPEDKLEWARRMTYQHLKREGCLQDYGIPVIAAYEEDLD